MPYKVVKDGKKYAIINLDTGKVVGHSDSEKKAWQSVGYRMQAENKTPVDRKVDKSTKGMRHDQMPFNPESGILKKRK